MSRTTKALKRLGVPVLAAVTMVAGVPALVGTANADHVSGVTLTAGATTPAGTCQQFTATYTVSNSATPTATIDVNLTPSGGSAATVAFCDTTPNATGQELPTQSNTVGTTTLNGEFTSNDGSITFGVVSNTAETVSVTAFAELNASSNDVVNTGEPSATSTATFTTGGVFGVATVDAEPETGFAVAGQSYDFTATALNSSGQPVPGTAVFYDVIAGPDAPAVGATSCGTTDQSGKVTCTLVSGAGAGTDTIRVYVNKPASASTTDVAAETNAYDANDPSDDITVTFQAPQAAGTTVTLTCATNPTNTAGNNCQLPTTQKTQELTATVKNSAGAVQAGVAVSFAISTGGTADPAGSNDTESLSQTQCLTDANGTCKVTATDTVPTNGETIQVTATIQTASGPASATSTTTYQNPVAADARVITLSPPATGTVGSVVEVTATVVDRFGNPVPGVFVNFTESGTGRFIDSSSITDAQGKATAELSTQANEAPGSTTVTATIQSGSGAFGSRGSGTNDDECEQAAGATGGVANSAPGAPAGDCDATTTVTFVAAGSQSPTPTPTSTAGQCAVTPTVTLEFGTINATGSSGVTVTAPANSQIQLLAYSQPSTTYRVVRNATIDNTGTPAQFRITPPTNTRLYAQIVGCTTNPTTASKVLNVRTTLSLNVTRTGTRAYRFFGDSLPARPGGLIVSLYRVTDSGSQILTAQTRASASTGDWVINRVFTGTGRFGFVVRTGQDLQNAPGASNVRSLLIF